MTNNNDPIAMIEFENVTKTYSTTAGERISALAGIEGCIYEHEFASVIGPSGCGKSTLLKIVAGLLPATQGQVKIQGRLVKGPQKGSVGVVFQGPVLLPWKSILDNILLPVKVLHLDREVGEDKYIQRALELIRLVELESFEKCYPRELSGGMQQRVSIARALIYDPAILLMDEPFGALDAITREQMNLELQKIWNVERKTVMFITHNIPEAVFLSDRVFVMGTRPGRFVDVVEVNLPRPRDLAVMGMAEFAEISNVVRRSLEKHAAITLR